MQESGGFRPDWAGPFLGSFSSEQNAARCRQAEIVRLQTNDFTDPRPGIEHEAQQRQVATAVARIKDHRLQQAQRILSVPFKRTGTREIEHLDFEEIQAVF